MIEWIFIIGSVCGIGYFWWTNPKAFYNTLVMMHKYNQTNPPFQPRPVLRNSTLIAPNGHLYMGPKLMTEIRLGVFV